MRAAAVLIAALTVSAPTRAYAQLTVKAFAGINFGSDHGFIDLDDAASRVQATFGAAAALDVSDDLSIEVEFATSPKFLKGDSGLIESGRVDTFFANAYWRFGQRPSRLRPYLGAGFGTARVTLEDTLDAFTSTSTLAAVNVGGGVTAGTSTRVRLIADVRYVRSQYADAGAAGLGEEYVAFWRASAGVLLRF